MTGDERGRRDSRALEPELMEDLLGSLLANQLAEFYKSLGGKLPS